MTMKRSFLKAALRRCLAVAVSLALVCPQGLVVRAWSAETTASLDGLSLSEDVVTIKLSAPAASVLNNAFLTADPPRLVIELLDTANQWGGRELPGKGRFLSRVRAAQYQRTPRMISRVVLDLKKMAGYRIASSGETLVVQLVDEAEEAPARAPAPKAAAAVEASAAAAPRAKRRPAPRAAAAADEGPSPVEAEEPGAAKASPTAKAVLSRGDIMSRLSRDLVTLDFDNTDVRDVFKLLAVKARANVIFGSDVAATPPLTLHLSDVPFNEAIQTILSMTGLVTSQVGDNILRVLTPTQLAKERSTATTVTKVVPLSYSKAVDLMTAVNSVRAAEKRTGATTADTKTNSLIVTESPEGMVTTERLIAQLDVRPKQVLIEAKLVEVGLSDTLDFGVQWDYFSADKGSALGKQGISTIGTPIGQTTASPLPVGTLDQNSAYQTVSGPTGGNFPIGGTTNGRGTGVNLGASSVFGALTLGRITNSYILNLTLSAAASQGKVKVLSDPKVATLNNQPANINVTTSWPYVTSNVASTGVATQTVSYTITGIKLTVTPTINADGRITLDINPDVSQPAATAVTAGTTGAIATDSRTAKTTVLVKDGETIVIGGLIADSMTDQVAKIPLLGDIPILGWLFRKKHKVRTRSELLIFVTPKIMPD